MRISIKEKVSKQKKLVKIFEQHNGYANYKDILKAGFNYRYINETLENGVITKVKNGIYKLEGTFISNQGLVEVTRAIPEGVICLTSALDYYELTTFIPSTVSVAIYYKSWRPKIDYPPVDFYYFSKKLFELGVIEVAIEKHKIRIYDIEKTICDIFRYRNKLGIDTVKEALSEYLKRRDRNLEKLLSYADICRIKSIVETWLQAMV